jgi:cytochrome c553
MKWTPWIRVVETDLVPTTRIVGNLFIATSTARTEPIAGRIIEVPEDEEQSEVLRNPRSGFVAYVPIGSIKRGELLATTGAASVGGTRVAGRTLACITCHGPNLMGMADTPGIAGRSPSYLVRQMYDFQRGTRRGKMSPLMQPAVAHLTNEDMADLAAYVASLVPPG